VISPSELLIRAATGSKVLTRKVTIEFVSPTVRHAIEGSRTESRPEQSAYHLSARRGCVFLRTANRSILLVLIIYLF